MLICTRCPARDKPTYGLCWCESWYGPFYVDNLPEVWKTCAQDPADYQQKTEGDSTSNPCTILVPKPKKEEK